jgi:hypothetical protein
MAENRAPGSPQPKKGNHENDANQDLCASGNQRGWDLMPLPLAGVSGPCTNPITGAQQYFRLTANQGRRTKATAAGLGRSARTA